MDRDYRLHRRTIGGGFGWEEGRRLEIQGWGTGEWECGFGEWDRGEGSAGREGHGDTLHNIHTIIHPITYTNNNTWERVRDYTIQGIHIGST